MKTASAKAKGRALQQRLVQKLLEVYTDLEPDDIKSNPMGCSGEDVLLSPAARKLHRFSWECKSYKAFSIYSIMEQCEYNAGDFIPALYLKGNRKEPLVVLKEEDFLEMLKELHND